ncbi:MAG: hypothetical protein ACOCUI_02215 [bacterium]
MSFMIKNNLFFHVPKTGGVWLTKTLSDLFKKDIIYLEDYTKNHITYEKTKYIKGINRIAIVRHPYSWYVSYWAYRNKTSWNKRARFKLIDAYDVDKKCKSENFYEYMNNILKYKPSFYSDILSLFIGQNADKVDYIIKYENLYDDLSEVLKITKLGNYSQNIFKSYSLKNESPKEFKNHAYKVFTEDIKNQIWKHNYKIISTLNYNKN